MEDSIFTRIIKGEIPCHKVYEDDHVLGFLDINPILPGHILMVSKLQIDHVYDLPDDEYKALWSAVKRVAAHAKGVMGTTRSVLLVMGYDVPHAHVHIIPSNTSRNLYDSLVQITDINKDSVVEPDHTALAQIAQRLQI